jgi:hypothetical protein
MSLCTAAVYSTGNNKVYVANGYGGTGGQCIMRIYHDGSNWVWDDLAFGGEFAPSSHYHDYYPPPPPPPPQPLPPPPPPPPPPPRQEC